MKGRKHTEEAKARIGAAARERRSAAKALAARWEGHAPPPRPVRKVLTPDERKAASKRRLDEWTAKNPERAKEIKRRSYEKNREARNAKQREKNADPSRKAFMREYAPKHRAANPVLYAIYSHNRRAAELGAPGSHTELEWLALVIAWCCCAYCGAEGKMTRDHATPLARGGSNDIGNILPACKRCNSKKGTLTADEYRARLREEGPSMDERWARQLAEARAR